MIGFGGSGFFAMGRGWVANCGAGATQFRIARTARRRLRDQGRVASDQANGSETRKLQSLLA
jgi:hypothetical protein